MGLIRVYIKEKNIRVEMVVFLALVAMVALANGLSDSVYTNYFKEVYDVTALQRGFIEWPRELPGVLCAFVIAFLAKLGDLKIALIAEILAFIGILAMGLITPAFGIMLIFLFINSLGMHTFMPLQDSIGMSLAEPNRVGERMGQYASMKSMFGMIAGIIVFFGFRYNILSFDTDIKWVFVIGAIASLLAICMCLVLIKRVKVEHTEKRKVRLFFRKEYKYYYCLTILQGVQKQIALVYGSWVIVDLLLKGADIMALLLIIANFLGVFFMKFIGNCTDRFGIRKMMFVDALSFIFVYVIYGCVVWAVAAEVVPNDGIAVMVVYLLFILDRLSMQIGMVKAIYLKSIAVSEEEITATLSTGISLDHMVTMVAASVSGIIWTTLGCQWVFFIAAAFSLGNLYVAFKIKEK